MNNGQQQLVSVCAILMITLSACGTSPPVSLYLIEPVVAGGAESPTRAVTVQVEKVLLPERLTRKEILSRDNKYVVNIAMFDRWAEPLEANITSTLAENLSASIRSDRVIAYPWALAETADYRVTVQILAFGPAPGGDVVLKVLWRLADESGNTVELRRSSFSEPGQTSDTVATVGAMSRVLGELSEEIAATIRESSAHRGGSS